MSAAAEMHRELNRVRAMPWTSDGAEILARASDDVPVSALVRDAKGATWHSPRKKAPSAR
jgi:hypothetical protein